MAKKLTAFKFSQAMKDALDELVHPDRLLRFANSRTGWLELALDRLLRQTLKAEGISTKQIDVCRTHDDVFELFVNCCRAKRGEGYKLDKTKSMSFHEGDNENAKLKQLKDMPFELWVTKIPEK